MNKYSILVPSKRQGKLQPLDDVTRPIMSAERRRQLFDSLDGSQPRSFKVGMGGVASCWGLSHFKLLASKHKTLKAARPSSAPKHHFKQKLYIYIYIYIFFFGGVSPMESYGSYKVILINSHFATPFFKSKKGLCHVGHHPRSPSPRRFHAPASERRYASRSRSGSRSPPRRSQRRGWRFFPLKR